ncbi:MAG: hypothetical protein LBH01_07710 [Verrucomicrobiales bacterium]|nr:hypothetical protein [Verrucomicrobiales bacterium]
MAMLLTLTPHRVSINPNLLAGSAEELLSHAASPQSLAEFLNWSSPPEILTAGFAPQKDAKKLLLLMRENKLRKQLKAKRVAKGYADFIQPRKGFKGWWQKKFNDPKELQLACGYQVLDFLRESPRLQLLAALHDTLLAYVSGAEPRRVELSEIYTNINPLASMVANDDLAAADRLVVKALSAPLSKVSPAFIIENLHGHVFDYDQKRSFAHYFA